MRVALMARKSAGAHNMSSGIPAERGSAWEVFSVAAVSALFHVGTVLMVHLYSRGQILFPDAGRYETTSNSIALFWLSGIHPDPSDLARLSGSALWGYPAIMAACKVVTGGGWLAAKIVLALLVSTGAVAAYGLATGSGRGHGRAVAVGLVVGTSPTLLLWDAWGLKDGLVTSVVLWSTLLLVRMRFTSACLFALVSIQVCLYLRAAAALFVAVALLARVRFRRDHLAGLLVIVAAVAIFILPRVNMLFSVIDSLEIKDGTALEFTGGYGSRNLLSHPQYIAHFMFGPFPWAYGPETAVPERWLYLGTIVWIASLALAPAALKKAWADTAGVGRTLILGSSAYAALYLASFGGEFYRQRSLIECVIIVLIVLYLPLSPVAAVIRLQVWLAVVAALAILQSSYLTPTVWSKELTASVFGLLALLALMPNTLRGLPRGLPHRPLRHVGSRGRDGLPLS